jgi:hypothetical protein
MSSSKIVSMWKIQEIIGVYGNILTRNHRFSHEIGEFSIEDCQDIADEIDDEATQLLWSKNTNRGWPKSLAKLVQMSSITRATRVD